MTTVQLVVPTVPGFHVFEAPRAADIPETSVQFLQSLGRPTIIKIPGKTATTRVIVTLLHGNEPSGLHAIHRLLREEFVPQANTVFVIVSVNAAATQPHFHHRYTPGSQDINRCFRPPYQCRVNKLAKQLINYLVQLAPEAVVDVHNTSGNGPAFSVASRVNERNSALAAHFSQWFIHTDIRLGALMEVPFRCPIITVESGGARDEQANTNAYNGMRSYLSAKDVFAPRQEVHILEQPRRLELHKNVALAYADRPVFGANITIRQDIEQFNFGITQPGEVLGWVDHDQLEHFRLAGQRNNETLEQYFSAANNLLTVTRPLKFFMVTTRSDIALADCLLYFVDISEQRVLL